MWGWLVGAVADPRFVALSTVLVYGSVLVGVRFGERRALTQLTTFDFAVTIALGAIIARTATSQEPSYLQGLTALVTLLACHRLLSLGRRRVPRLQRLLEGEPLLLVRDGTVLPDGLRRARMTEKDLATALREHGVLALAEVAAVVLETRGAISVIRRGDRPVDESLLPAAPPPTPSRRRPPGDRTSG